MYVRVYSPDGEAFDVNRHTADDLILQRGWTQSPITVVEEKVVVKVKPKAKKSRKKKAADWDMPSDAEVLEAIAEYEARSSSEE